jgi:hypothetical protein
MKRIRPSLRIALWLAIGLQLGLLAVRFVLDLRLLGSASPPEGGILGVVADALTMAAFPAVGIVILRRQPANPVGWLFCVANIGWITSLTVRSYVHLGVIAEPGSMPAPDVVVWFFTWPGFVSSAFYILLVLLFPDGRFLNRRWRAVGIATTLSMGLAALLSAIAPGPVDPSLGTQAHGVVMTNPVGIGGPTIGPLIHELSTAGFPVAILLLLVALLSPLPRYRRAARVIFSPTTEPMLPPMNEKSITARLTPIPSSGP